MTTTANPGHQLPPHRQRPKRSRTPLVIGGVVVALLVAGVLAFGVFEVHTLLTDEEVAEAGPTFDSGVQADDPAPTGGTEPAGEGTAEEAAGDPGAAITVAASGAFEARDHPGDGTVSLLTDGNQTFVRFDDDFSTDNGPDLYAVAVVDGERVELGELKGNRGSQNYELPADIDPAAVEAVQVWCKRFDATFTEAALA